ncbi:MAG: ATP-binding protein [Balneolaceae bacterium]
MKLILNFFVLVYAFAPAAYGFQPKEAPFSWEELESQYLVRHYTVDDGLPVNTVSHMLHASDGFIYLLTLDGLVRFDGDRFRVFDSANTPGFKSNRFLNMAEGKDGEIWLNDDLNNLYLFKGGEAARLQDIEAFRDYKVNEFAGTSGGKIWISTNKGVLYQESGLDFQYPSKEKISVSSSNLVITQTDSVFVLSNQGLSLVNKKESRVVIPADELKIPLDRIYDVQSAEGNSIWLLSEIGSVVHISDTFDQLLYTYKHPKGTDHFKVLQLGDSSALIKTDAGYIAPVLSDTSLKPVTLKGSEKLFTYTIKGKINVPVLQHIDGTLFVNGIKAFRSSSYLYANLIDREGSIWLSTHGSGIYQIKRKKFITLGEALQDSLVNIYGMHDNGEGGIWAASFIGKVFHISDHQIKSYSTFLEDTQSKFFTAVAQTQAGDVYLGGFNTWKLNNDYWEALHLIKPGVGSVTAFFEDSKNRFWISTEQSLNQLIDGKLIPFYDENGITLSQVRSIQESRDGTLLFATIGEGVAFLGTDNTFRFVTDREGLSSNLVRDVFVSSTDTLWVVTENNGLTRLILRPDYTVLKAGHITAKDGLSDNSLHKLIEDEYGFFWINSNNKIMRVARQNLDDYLDGKSRLLNIESFGVNDGLLNNEGNGGRQNSGILSSDGKLLFPNQAGLIYTRPEWHYNQTNNLLNPPFAEYIGFRDTTIVFKNNTSFELPPSVREAHIKFTLPAFQQPDKLILEYKMDGVNTTWQPAGEERTAVFTNLPKGEHAFLMRGKLPGTNEYTLASVGIIVPALYYETSWFFLLGLSFAGIMLFLSFRVQAYRSKLREEKLNTLVNERTTDLEDALQEIKNLDESKSRFFTNFTHELRTPLSLILSPLEDILEGNRERNHPDLKQHLSLMQRNAIRLKDLVNRLLDVSKLTAGEFPLILEPVALDNLTNVFASHFEHALLRKELTLNIHSNKNIALIFVDVKAWDHITNNLLSNAIKYTPPGGKINIRFEEIENWLSISFSDTGVGIPEKEQAKIFEPYYQVGSLAGQAEGTGIGLALVKGLVQRMGGNIMIRSQINEGSTFTINLKKGSKHFSSKDTIKQKAVEKIDRYIPDLAVAEEALSPSNSFPKEPTGANILLVEDNEDFRNYFKSLLADVYHVKTATNGLEGLKVLTDFQPDLIISDIMMPEMDGYEMMKTIREIDAYRSVPFIFLSAKDSVFDIEAGLNSGADIYLTKPVQNKLLLTQIKALLRREQYIREIQEPEISRGIISAKVEGIIQRHLGNPELSMEIIAEAMLMSRTTLFRKWKKENKVSLIQTITNRRLEEAIRLIRKDELTISEAAYAVGYKHLSHFSKAFKKVYGSPPIEYLKESVINLNKD